MALAQNPSHALTFTCAIISMLWMWPLVWAYSSQRLLCQCPSMQKIYIDGAVGLGVVQMGDRLHRGWLSSPVASAPHP